MLESIINKEQRPIQNPVRQLRWKVLRNEKGSISIVWQGSQHASEEVSSYKKYSCKPVEAKKSIWKPGIINYCKYNFIRNS